MNLKQEQAGRLRTSLVLQHCIFALALVLLAGGVPRAAQAAGIDFPAIGTPGQSYPGKFVWFDLATDDLPSEREFYGAVFGWQFQPVNNAPASYTLAENAGLNIAGMFAYPRPAGAAAGARWVVLISVADADRAADYVKQHGGTVISPPASLPGRGTHALFRDPQGAVFGVLQSATGDPPDSEVDDGDFFWVDLLTTEPGKAADFYQGLAGYELSEEPTDTGGTRIVLAAGGYARAGVAPLPPGVKQPGWLPYILVDDVAATLQAVRKAGGKVLVNPRQQLLGGNLAVIADPSRGVLGIVNWVGPAPVAEAAQ